MALTAGQIDKLWQALMESGLAPPTVTKAQYRAAVVDIDAFFDTNATAINNAFPQPFKTQANLAQKAILVGVAALMRAVAEGVSVQTLRGVFD